MNQFGVPLSLLTCVVLRLSWVVTLIIPSESLVPRGSTDQIDLNKEGNSHKNIFDFLYDDIIGPNTRPPAWL